MPPLGSRCSRRPPRAGFALLITITLLAFLVLLLVGLATITRVETQVADNSQKQSQSRQNALAALGIALGQLQRFAGPDQRVTATASLAAAQDGTRFWTGVWGNRRSPESTTSEAGLLNWLVSGNEAVTIASAPSAAADFGQITSAPPSPAFLPGAAVIPSLAGSPDALTDLVSGTQRWRLLVGPRTTDRTSGYVLAPLENLEVAAGSLPGFSSADTTSTPIGRYAYWVGDEGVKARANLVDPHAAASAAERSRSFVVAQRSAVEWMDLPAPASGSLGALFPAQAAPLKGVLALDQLAFAASAPASLDGVVKARFHDLTVQSRSVLADTARGGLKKDLTRALSAGAPSAAETARGPTLAPPADTAYLFTPNNNGADTYGVPTWGLLRSFATKVVAPGGTVAPQPATGTQIGINPILTYAGLGLDFTCPALAAASPVYPAPINLNLFPVVVLWNPYTVTLQSADYAVAFGVPSSNFEVKLATHGSSTAKATFYLQRASFNSAASTGAYFRFRLRCPDLLPGQSIVFTLDPALAENTAFSAGVTELVPGANPLNAYKNVVIPTGATVASAVEAAGGFDITSTGGGEFYAVLAEFDPASASSLPSGSLPPSVFPRWYQTVQKVGQFGSVLPPLNSLALAADGSLGPRFGLRLQMGFSGAGSSLTNPDTGVQLQWIAHGNPRAPVATRAKLDNWLTTSTGAPSGYNPSYSYRRDYSRTLPWPTFNTLDQRASAGLSLDNNGTPVDVTLWEFPSADPGLLSLGQLQHANVSLLGMYPAYAIGNSLADFHLPRDQALTTDAGNNPPAATEYTIGLIATHYDLSWQLNRALWDRYFFATTPGTWTQADVADGNPLPNSRLQPWSPNGAAPSIDHLRANAASATSDPYNQAAAHLVLAGGFNVNSTSEQAWRALLAGVRQLEYNPRTRDTGRVLQAAFARFAAPTADDDLATPWQGYRQLDEAQIRQLAANIVAEVRLRGPFLSLAEFVNRRLATGTTGLKGALQAALDATASGATAANNRTAVPFNSNFVTQKPNTGETWDLGQMRNDDDLTITSAAHLSRATFAPKFLTQADLLTTLGPALTARSDTFLIRTCGESLNPLLTATDAGYVTGRAWCEAVVQRLPDYVDSADPALAALGAATPPVSTHTANQTFGRRFQIISFRWLTPADI